MLLHCNVITFTYNEKLQPKCNICALSLASGKQMDNNMTPNKQINIDCGISLPINCRIHLVSISSLIIGVPEKRLHFSLLPYSKHAYSYLTHGYLHPAPNEVSISIPEISCCKNMLFFVFVKNEYVYRSHKTSTTTLISFEITKLKFLSCPIISVKII